MIFLISIFLLNAEEWIYHTKNIDFSDIPKPYFAIETASYAIPNDLYGEKLFEYLHKITEIKSSHTYSEAKSFMFYELDNTLCPTGKNGVWAFYSNICVEGKFKDGSYYKEKGDENGDGYIDSKGMNVEHLWPQSSFNSTLPMKADLHHLRPTFIYPNNKRGNLPFYYVKTPIYQITTSNAKTDGTYFEPLIMLKEMLQEVCFTSL